MNRGHLLSAALVVALGSYGSVTAWGLGQDVPPTPTPPSDQPAESEGEVIRLGETQTEDLGPEHQPAHQRRLLTVPGNSADLREQRAAVSSYYIGLGAVPVDPALRAHVDLPEGVGLLVEEVFEGSPSEEAGFRQYDIVVSAAGREVSNVSDLVDVVDEHGGEDPRSFDLEVIRHGKAMSLTVTPAPRPEVPQGERLRSGFRGRLGDRLESFRMRPGIGPFDSGFPAPFNLGQVPGGVSITVDRQGDAPPKITVKRGGESWVIEGDDPEALEQLPEDLRPMVEGMLQQPDGEMPMMEGLPEGMFEDFNFEERMQRMEEQMRRMQQQLEESLNG